MEIFLGIKLVDAEPCLGSNNKCIDINQELSGNEIEGYKVVYEDGYTSWCPKNVFERSYKLIKTLQDLDQEKWLNIKHEDVTASQNKILNEMLSLNKKIDKLDNFIVNNSKFKKLSEKEQNLLIQQTRAMSYYFSILIERINNF